MLLLGRKRDTYDRYGKDVLGGTGSASCHSCHSYGSHTDSRYRSHAARGASTFEPRQFRDPFEVFDEFFGGIDPFADIFGRGESWTV